MPSLHTNRGAKRARECRAELGLDPKAPLECLLTLVEDGLGLPVVIASLGEGIAGAVQQRGDFRLVFVNGRQAVSRQRFTLAHELGHLRCRHDLSHHYDTWETVGGHQTSSAEVQANAFAAELLTPKEALADLLDDEPGLDQVVTLAAAYGMSALAMLFSLYRAELATEQARDALRARIDEGEHLALAEELAVEWPEDRLAEVGAHQPYLSPALEGSALWSTVHGDRTVEEAARASGVPAGTLRPAVERLTAAPPHG